jgi:hypothetical protein
MMTRGTRSSRLLNAEFRADKEREAAEETEVEEDGDDDLDFIDDLPDLEETAAEQRAILVSYESAKKVDDIAHAREEAEEEHLRHTLDLSVQRVPSSLRGHLDGATVRGGGGDGDGGEAEERGRQRRG